LFPWQRNGRPLVNIFGVLRRDTCGSGGVLDRFLNGVPIVAAIGRFPGNLLECDFKVDIERRAFHPLKNGGRSSGAEDLNRPIDSEIQIFKETTDIVRLHGSSVAAEASLS